MNDNTNSQAVTVIDRMLGFRELARGVKENILAGEIDSLDAMVALKGVKKAVELLEKDAEINESVMSRFDMYNEKTVNLKHASITIKDTGVKYDYTVCNDIVYNELMMELDALNKRIKERQEFLKTLPENGLDVLDHNTGEVYTLYKPLRLASQTLEYKFKK